MNTLEKLRRASLENLQKLGVNPYPAEMFAVSHQTRDIILGFTPEKESDFKEVSLAGRIMSRRIMGKASFMEVMDASGRIQIYLNRDDLCPNEDKTFYETVFKKYLDIGDFVGVTGYVFKTKMGEITLRCQSLKVLSKAVAPLPIVKVDAEGQPHDDFADTESRYRKRILDLVVHPQVKDIFIKRSKIFRAMRNHLDKQGYLEVETPILQPIPGGAAASPFVTHHNTLDMPLYLRIANELYLKQLIAGGFEAVYEFAKDFRNEGMDRSHNPEFTQMELYVAYKDYLWMMTFTENMLAYVCQETLGSHEVTYQGKSISLRAPYPRVPILQAIQQHTGFDVGSMDEAQLIQTCHTLGIDTQDTTGVGKLIDKIFSAKCEPHYIQPTFITDYPKSMSPLTKAHRHNDQLTERFELIINGREIANAYSELNDPIDQRQRFEEQQQLLRAGDPEAMHIDEGFLQAMEYGMPPMAGIGIGMDRLTMLLTDQKSIQEVIFFPQMKPQNPQA